MFELVRQDATAQALPNDIALTMANLPSVSTEIAVAEDSFSAIRNLRTAFK